MLVDSHCHLNRLNLSAEWPIEKILEEAKINGVQHMLCVCVVLEDFPAMLKLVEPFPGVSVSVGLHPDEHLDNVHFNEPTADDIFTLGQHEKCVAIGETGLDYYRLNLLDKNDVAKQVIEKQRFRNHIQAARQLKKPLIIHTRSASEDTILLMREEKANEARGVLHCFTETWEVAKQALDLGFYISFSGIITFKNAEALREVVRKMPMDRLLIETDSPYLAPVPYRGKQNQPAYVKYVAEAVAELRKLSFEEVAYTTSENYFDLFSTAKRIELSQ